MAERTAEQAAILTQVPQQIRDTLTYFECNKGDELKEDAAMREVHSLLEGKMLAPEIRAAILASQFVNFKDGMKFALGLIKASEIKSGIVSLHVGVEVPLAKAFNPEKFEVQKGE